MEINLTILKYFFENPEKEFYIRELSRISKINHTTIRKKLQNLLEDKFLEVRKTENNYYYRLLDSKKIRNLRLFYNLEKIRESGLIEYLEQELDYPPIILFGSYSQALDDKDSDLDLFIKSNIKKKLGLDKFSKILKRKIQIHLSTDEEFKILIKKNPELINNICNGITLSGKIELIK